MTSGTPGIRLTDLELLSAYLDDELSPRERAALEARLAAEPALQTELDKLRRTVQILRATPLLIPPRSFVLDPAVYRRGSPWWLRYGAFRLVGMLGTAAALLFIVFGVLLMSNGATRPALQSIAYQATQPVAGLLAQATASAVLSAPTSISEGDAAPSNAGPSAPPALALMATATSAASDAILAQVSSTPLATATARLERTEPPPSPSPEGRDKGSLTGRAAAPTLPPAPTVVPKALGGMATTVVESLAPTAGEATTNSRKTDETRTVKAPAPSGGPGDGAGYMMTPTPAALTMEQPAQETTISKSGVGVPPSVAGTAAPSVPTAAPTATLTATTTAAPTATPLVPAATPTAAPTHAPLPSATASPATRLASKSVPSATPPQDSAANAVSSPTATPSRTVTPGFTPSPSVTETPVMLQSPDSLGPGARLLLVGGLALLIISLLVFGIAWARSRL